MFGGQGLGATMAQGAAFGAGSAAAHMAVRSLMGGGGGGHEGGHGGGDMQAQQPAYGGEQPAYYEQEQPQQQALENPCVNFNQSLLTCL